MMTLQFAFLASDFVAGQVQEPVSKFMKKDFVPYSEKRAIERQLLLQREDQDAKAAEEEEAREAQERDNKDAEKAKEDVRQMNDLTALSDLESILPSK